MQDEIQKSQQILSSKSQYYKKQDPSSLKSKQKRPKPKKFSSNASEYLSFKIEKKDPIVKTFKQAIQTNNEITLSPFYRFAVKSGDYRQFHNDPNLAIDWGVVRKVRILTDSEVKCPICLEQDLLVGRANKCGHYYCWPCIIRYMWVSDVNKRCPVCNASLKSLDLRPVSVQIYTHLTEGSFINLVLIKRPKGFITLLSANYPSPPTSCNLTFSDSQHTWFNKLSIYSESQQDYIREKAQLLSALQSTSDEFEKSSIQKALEFLEKNSNIIEPIQEAKKDENLNFYYFYQVSDGQPYFLHPINMAMLKKQFGSWDLCPVNLKCKLIEIESVHVTEAEQRKYGQISHLGRNVVAYFVEVDLKSVVNQEVFNEFKQDLTKRQKDRARFKRIEEKIQKKISIRRKNEEEANSLLLSYFDNPVIAPVQKVVTEKKEENVEKKEEKSENKEEEKVDSRSIWSNFKEVLKRPPREKQVVEKEVEVEDESPKKLTMFDLIKTRSIG